MAVITTSYFYSTGGVLTVGGTTPPTQAQMIYANQVICQLTAADGDTTCTITHNMQLTAAQIANKLPIISSSLDGTNAGTVYPVIAYTVTANTVTVAKSSVVGSNNTTNVTINRPLSSTL